MATVVATPLAPRIYGLDAICAAALEMGGEDAAQFARRLFRRVAAG
jgi:glutamate dehydrogenase